MDLQKTITSGTEARPLDFQIDRGGRTMNVWITPRVRDEKNVFQEVVGKTKLIGVAPTLETRKESPVAAVSKAFVDTAGLTELTVIGIVKLIKGSISTKNVGGPILIFQQVGQQAKAGKSSFLSFLALISINLGVLNLLPVPILDGGHIAFSIIEMVVRRKVPTKAVEIAQKVGLGIILCIMALAFFNDFMRLFHVR